MRTPAPPGSSTASGTPQALIELLTFICSLVNVAAPIDTQSAVRHGAEYTACVPDIGSIFLKYARFIPPKVANVTSLIGVPQFAETAVHVPLVVQSATDVPVGPPEYHTRSSEPLRST